ncbi:MAG: PAS domain S-box protein [Deltaproteobacteria bacterium]|nr:PAS domain S-box protein [Deltaproteobacteria bacterium]
MNKKSTYQDLKQRIETLEKEADEARRLKAALEESAAKYRQLFDHSPAGIYRLDFRTGRFVEANDVFCKYLGYSREELVSLSPFDILTEESKKLFAERLQKVAAGEDVPEMVEYEIVDKKGKRLFVRINVRNICDADGRTVGADVVAHEITNLKQAEEALLLTQFAMDHAPDGVLMINDEGIVKYANKTACDSMGYSREELVGMKIFDIDPDFPIEGWEQHKNELKSCGKMTFEGRHRTKDGRLFPVEVNTNYVEYKGRFLAVAFDRDVAERKKAEETLRASEAKYRSIFDNAIEGIHQSTPEGRFISVNPAMARMCGYESPEDMIANVTDISTQYYANPLDRERFKKHVHERGSIDAIEYQARRKDGSVFWVSTNSRMVRDDQSQTLYYEGRSYDITDRKKTEEALRASEERFKSIVSTSQEWIWAIDAAGSHTFSNPAVENILGYRPDEIIEFSASTQLIFEEDIPKMRELMARSIEQKTGWSNVIIRWKHRDGTYRWLESNAVPILDDTGVLKGFQGSDRDITDRKRDQEALRESTELYTRLVNTLPDVIIRADLEGKISFINDQALRISGYSRDEIEGRNVFMFVSPEDRDRMIQNALLMMKRRLGPQEYQLIMKDGRKIPFEVNGDVLRTESGAPFGLVFACRDISDRKQVEEALRSANVFLDSIVEHVPNMIFIKDAKDLKFVRINLAGEELLGYSRSELLGKSDYDFFPKDQADCFREKDQEVLAGKTLEDIPEEPVLTRGKGELILHTQKVPILDASGESKYLLGISEDITERKRSEETLRESEIRYQSIFENTGTAMLIIEEDMTISFANVECEKLTGYAQQEIEGKRKWTEFVEQSDLERMIARHKLRRTNKDLAKRSYEFRLVHRDGHIKDILLIVDLIPGTKKSVASLIDITDRNRAEEALRETQRRLTDIIEFLPDATLVVDKEGKIVAWNRAMEVMTGVRKEDMLGKGDYEYAVPLYGERRPILIDFALHPERATEGHYIVVRRSGNIIYGESHAPIIAPGALNLSGVASVLRDSKGEIIAAIECIRDDTERKRMEERLNRAEKMEALGTLAGGVAHDLNNVLGVLVGYSELLAEQLPEGSSMKRYADNIFQSGIRGAAIIQDLLTLARRGAAVSEVVNLNKLISEYLKTPDFENMQYRHPQVKILSELEEGLLNVKGSSIHLSKTIMNLVLNAMEAISGRGEVTIATRNCYLDNFLPGYDNVQEGDYVVLTVSDTGGGISTEDLGKIFEPFYTKKIMGRSGTGLGLAVVWGTVKDHHGYIDVQTEKGKGSAFSLYLPVTREQHLAQGEKTASLLAYTGKGESILVVDDVKEQRKLAASMLERLGYRVEAVAGGEDAVEYLKDKKADLVILDMIMDPGIDGLETYRRIHEMNPRQKAIIVSGYSETDRVRAAQQLGAGTFVRKPYVLEKIGLAIRNELDRKEEKND